MSRHPNFWQAIKKFTSVVFLIIAGIILLQRSDLELGDEVEEVRAFTRQIEFDFVSWTLNAFGQKLQQMSLDAADYMSQEDHSQIVLNYLSLNNQIQQVEGKIHEVYANPDVADPESASSELEKQLQFLNMQREELAPLAETVLENQVSEVLAEFRLTLRGQPVPPVMFHVSPVPRGLVVSPRGVIRQDANVSIDPEITIAEMEALEEEVDETLDVSSLVVGLGGIGLYPTMVMETNNINWLAEVVSHEWVHNFLTLRPLGASYTVSPELRVINETVANLVEKEIGGTLIEKFYPEYMPPPPAPLKPGEETIPAPEPPPFDFRAEMHETRLNTDVLLAEGKVGEAEVYMEARRQLFWEHGYRIRKLNQAYFAFYGAYADQPGGPAGATEDPIGDAVRKLRNQSPSLAAFLNKISWMWSLEQLVETVEAGE